MGLLMFLGSVAVLAGLVVLYHGRYERERAVQAFMREVERDLPARLKEWSNGGL